MKIRKLEIRNYRSLRDVAICPQDVLALVGRNNSGKSNVIRALELFFEPTTRLVDQECFHCNDESQPIEIVVTFEGLTAWEQEQFAPWMNDGRLVVGRQVVCEAEGSYSVKTVAHMRIPEPDWLRVDEISRDRIDEWWAERDQLTLGALDFVAKLGSSKPSVKKWKEAIEEFTGQYPDDIPWIEERRENPKGYPGVLKGALPQFIHVPAVRDISEEAKVGKANPFGQLVNSILEKVSDENKQQIARQLEEVKKLLNRGEAGERLDQIERVEERLNKLMGELMDCDVEIEISVPQLSQVFAAAKIYADDGTRTSVETKGHGLQRSMILTILRAYAELTHTAKAGDRAEQRSTIFAIEEPELYLHPQCQRTLMSVLRDIAMGNDQVIYSTQSNQFVDIGHFDEICIMRREKRDGTYESYATQLPISHITTDLKTRTGKDAAGESIREHYSHAFNPMINEGFFADKVAIVEGPSEQYSLPIYADGLGYNLDRNNVSAVDCGGKGQIDRVLRVFNGFRIPSYVWFDGDKDSKDSRVRGKTLELLELLGDPLENIDEVQTKVTDTYAVLEYDLERTLRGELEDYDKLLDEAASTLGPTGKPLKHRFIATRLRQMITDGHAPEQVLPKTIVEIVRNLERVSYSGTVLRGTQGDPAG